MLSAEWFGWSGEHHGVAAGFGFFREEFGVAGPAIGKPASFQLSLQMGAVTMASIFPLHGGVDGIADELHGGRPAGTLAPRGIQAEGSRFRRSPGRPRPVCIGRGCRGDRGNR